MGKLHAFGLAVALLAPSLSAGAPVGPRHPVGGHLRAPLRTFRVPAAPPHAWSPPTVRPVPPPRAVPVPAAPPPRPAVVVRPGPAPSPRHHWVAPYWYWHGGRWVWWRGGWFVPPFDAYEWYGPLWVVQLDGSRVFVDGRWVAPDDGEVVAPGPPPPPRTEVPPPAPTADSVWAEGWWAWTGTWVWVPGRWIATVPGYAWAPPRWYPRPDGRWRLVPGGWLPTQ